MTIMNEIVGESGEQGEGCLSAVALVLAVVLTLTVGAGVLWSWFG